MKKIIFLLYILFFGYLPDWRTGYVPAIDLSVGCAENPVQQSDVSIELIDPNILRLVADPHRGGAFIGVIAGKALPFDPNRTYTLSGQFRKPVGHPEHISINMQYIGADYVEHYGEIVWGLNPFSPLYGKIWTRNKLDKQIILFDLPDDSKWHSFTLVIYHGESHIIKSISVDQHFAQLDLVEGTVPGKTYRNYFGILLEVQNMYTNCNPLVRTTGVSDWRDVQIISD